MLKMAELGAADLIAARDQVKVQARIGLANEDALVTQLARTAFSLCEAFCGQALILRDAQEVIAVRSGWQRLSAAPVTAITAVDGLPGEGAAFRLPVDRYAIDIDEDGIGRVRVIDAGIAGRLRVGYAAGLAAAWADLPAPLAQGIVCLAAHLYAHRSDAAEAAPPAAVAALWRPWRRLEIGA